MADAMRDLLQRSLNRIEELQSCEADELEVEALVQDLHAALAEQPTQPAGRCSYCLTYNGHQDGCIYAPPAPSVPEGWKLVPVEPTPEMREVGGMVCGTARNGRDPVTAAHAYLAMLAAAPEVPRG